MTGTEFFAGFLSTAAPDALEFMQEPEAPSNYKKPEAIREFKDRARESFMDRAAFQGVTGGLVAVHVEDAGGRPVFSMANDNPGAVSCRLVHWLVQSEFDDYPPGVGAAFTPRRRLWGFGLDQMLRIAGLETLRYGHLFNVPTPPLRLWYKNSGVFDPYEIITGSAERRAVSLAGVCRYLGLKVDADGLNPESPAAHMNTAKIARLLTYRAGLTYFNEGTT